MANNFDKNFTTKILKRVVGPFEHSRTVSSTINTQTIKGEFNPDTGSKVLMKRPTDAVTIRTPDGDISAFPDDPIITGTAFGEVQDYITVRKSVSEAAQALEAGTDSDRFWEDIGHRLATDFDIAITELVGKNTGLLQGTPGNPITGFKDVVRSHSLMKSVGVPSSAKKWNYLVNPYSQGELADETRKTLNVGSDIKRAHRDAMIGQYAGMNIMSATVLPSYTTSTGVDRTGTLSATPDATYLTAKDSMTQIFNLSGLEPNLVIKAGEQIKISARKRLNLASRRVFLDHAQTAVPFTATVVNEVTLNGSGEGAVTVTGPALFEANGAYNTVDSAPQSGDVVELLGPPNRIIQPNLFYHPDAFSVASVPMERLSATQSFTQTSDGIIIRVTKYSDKEKNLNKLRFDIRFAFMVANPFYAGVGYGE